MVFIHPPPVSWPPNIVPSPVTPPSTHMELAPITSSQNPWPP